MFTEPLDETELVVSGKGRKLELARFKIGQQSFMIVFFVNEGFESDFYAS